jgi:hypothetical protein
MALGQQLLVHDWLNLLHQAVSEPHANHAIC